MTSPAVTRVTTAGARPGRGLLIAQYVLLAVHLAGTFGVLLCAVVQSGDWGGFLDPGLERLGDPKDSMSSNPILLWALGLPYTISVYVRPLPVIGLVIALFALVAARGRSPKAAFLTVVWTVLTVLACTPYGSAIHNWLLD
ncbi:hypothetical protein Ait01nite_073910 [Actinoplanes italicus]|uniref:Uncharacterized protein n=1 Tax=Actinoplanes italicus TaxID=113567 RepID=A0A2T0K0F7_9ACTN|nr:hypothetical protein [Actinoplanes italicus]PRX16271.1 hypothetical protein CLV67_12086 [Actinoplanes italicus]GIE34346.1 hypothetical protein Ait01nite_073910 [Actinoplanes italicus]